ncbi:MAG: VRR-NUC domain-containing protein, partial [Salegentibacter mishustinae]|nr:VRR-NUC domain-containing protein [Salegentibacter mishustinae]
DDFVDWVRDYPAPAIALKLKLFSGKGWPDRTILCAGHLFFIEFKAKDKRHNISPQQNRWRRLLKRLGFRVYVCTSCEEAIEKFKKEIQPT